MKRINYSFIVILFNIAFFIISSVCGNIAIAENIGKNESKVIKIAKNFKCIVCQGESLAYSQAQIAQDFRDVIRELISQNKSELEIMIYLTKRYNNQILLSNPWYSSTLMLWIIPIIFLIITLLLIKKKFLFR